MSDSGSNAEGFPEWALDADQTDMANTRAVAEWLYQNRASSEDRRILRAQAAQQRDHLSRFFDLEDYEVVDALWESWYCSTATWQTFILGDCSDVNHMLQHALRAVQWSGIVLLLATDRTITHPDEETETS